MIPVGSNEQEASGSWNESKGIVIFDPSKWTGITGIYFVCAGYVSRDTYKVQIELYDKSNLSSIVINEYTTTSPVLKLSADIKSSFETYKQVTVRVKTDQTGGANTGKSRGAYIMVTQEINDWDKKSVSYYQAWFKQTGQTLGVWNNCHTLPFYPKLENCDGIIRAHIETNTYTSTGQPGYVKLYDNTAAADVLNSLITVTGVSNAHYESPELILYPNHNYTIRSKNAGFFGSYETFNNILRIEHRRFSKIVSVPVNIYLPDKISTSGFTDHVPTYQYNAETIDASGDKTINLDYIVCGFSTPAADVNYRWYDKTGSAVIDGTEHLENFDGLVTTTRNETPTMPEANSNITFQSDSSKVYYILNGYLQATLEEESACEAYIEAKRKICDGYHSFIKQFIENMSAGHTPLFTPDAVNRCW